MPDNNFNVSTDANQLRINEIRTYIQTGEYDEAMKHLNAWINEEKQKNGYCAYDELYWLRLLAKNKVSNDGALVALAKDFSKDSDYLFAIQPGTSDSNIQHRTEVMKKVREGNVQHAKDRTLWCIKGITAQKAGNYAEAVRWYRKAAEQGYADAQYCLGTCYELGLGVSENPAEAFSWYRKAAEQGLARAQFCLGMCYELGTGVSEDLTEAIRWNRMAAEQGNADAQFSLGVCYAKGCGVSEDPAEAVRWYRKAAEQGNAKAQCCLGFCFENGQGVRKDLVKAAGWFRMAAKQGYERAIKELARLDQT